MLAEVTQLVTDSIQLVNPTRKAVPHHSTQKRYTGECPPLRPEPAVRRQKVTVLSYNALQRPDPCPYRGQINAAEVYAGSPLLLMDNGIFEY